MNEKCVAGFGEIMLRLTPADRLRFGQVLPGEICGSFGGGEANVCVSLARLGLKSRFLTALPKNLIVDALFSELKSHGVDVSKILKTNFGRLGIYFTETGSNQRSSNVVYDREFSAVSMAQPDDYDFDAMLEGVDWLHLTGITPALSESGFLSTLAIANKAKKLNIPISLDVNYRNKLWKWRPDTEQKSLARECMTPLASIASVIICNEADASDVFGIAAKNVSFETGKFDAGAYTEVAHKLSQQFTNLEKIAITLRESISADHNNWGAVLLDTGTGRTFFAPSCEEGVYKPYEIRNIVDRIGGGDSFCAGLIYALNSNDYSAPEDAVAFAAAASCLKHSIYGDFNLCSLSEIFSLLQGDSSGRIKR